MNGRMPGAVRWLRESLGRSLFATAPGRGSTLGRGEFALVLLALLALGAVLQVFRVGPSAALGAFWAEDGQVFFSGAMLQGFFDAVLSPYAGYLVVVPRLIGEAGEPGAAGGLAPASRSRSAPPSSSPSAASRSGTPAPARSETPTCAAPSSWSRCWRRWRAWRRSPPPPTSPGTCCSPASGCCSGARRAPAAPPSPASSSSPPRSATLASGTSSRSSSCGCWPRATAATASSSAATRSAPAIQLPVTLTSSENTVEPVWTSDIWTAFVQRVVDGAALGESLGGEAWSELGLAVPDRPAGRPRRLPARRAPPHHPGRPLLRGDRDPDLAGDVRRSPPTSARSAL